MNARNAQLFLISLLFSTACSQTKFVDSSSVLASAGSPNASSTESATGVPDAVVCDPFQNGAAASAAGMGLHGSIYALSNREAPPTSSQDLIQRGNLVTSNLFMNKVLTPTVPYQAGFLTTGGNLLKAADGSTLIELFALDLRSQMTLGPGDAPGDYELAIISDDGATLSVTDGQGVDHVVVNNDGKHVTEMGCTSTVVHFDSVGQKIPIHLTYYQGLRFNLALVLIWRKVTDPSIVGRDSECGQIYDTNWHFFNYDEPTRASSEAPAFQALRGRGWTPLSEKNFSLPMGVMNRCT